MKRFHVHIAVDNLQDNIRFYSALFGIEPSVSKPTGRVHPRPLALREGIETFLSLLLDDLQQNPSAFRTKLDYIGILKFKPSHAK